MRGLSPRLTRLLRLSTLTALSVRALPAAAQLPTYAAPAAAAEAPRATAELQPAPRVTPPPAKTEVITEQRAASSPPPHDDEPVPVEPPPRRRWYGWQTLAADGASLAVFLTAGIASSGNEGFGGRVAAIGAVSYGLTPGIIHFVHRNPGRGFASFGIRLGMPLAGVFIGASAASGCSGFLCEAGGAAVGALIGAGGAIAIDAAVLAYEDPPDHPPIGVSFQPLISVTPKHALFGVAGRL